MQEPVERVPLSTKLPWLRHSLEPNRRRRVFEVPREETMDTLLIQDVFEPYYAGRKGFAASAKPDKGIARRERTEVRDASLARAVRADPSKRADTKNALSL
jgi:hypothetical protein